MNPLIHFIRKSLSQNRLSKEQITKIKSVSEKRYKSSFRYSPIILNGLERFGLRKKKVLDVGCGWSPFLINFGKDSVGVDLTKERIEFGKKIGLNIVEANIEKPLPFKEEFEAVWASHIIEHLVSPFVTINLLRNVLKKNGLIIITVPIISTNIFHKLFRGLVGNEGWDAPMHIIGFTPKSLKFQVERCGFKIVDSGHFLFKSRLLNKLTCFLPQIMGQLTVVGMKSDKMLRPQIFPPVELEKHIYYDKKFVKVRRQDE